MRATAWVTSIILVLVGCLAVQADNKGPVIVSLRKAALIDNSIVLVKHVAELQGGTAEVHAQIGNLDLADLPGTGPGVLLSQKHVACRLQMLGLPTGSYRLEGATSVQVRQSCPCLTEDDLIDAARQHILRRSPWPVEELLIRSRQPVTVPEVPLSATDAVRLEPEMAVTSKLLGAVQVNVDVLVNGRCQVVVPVSLEVRRIQPVAVATCRIERGELLTEENLHKDWRPLSGSGHEIPWSESIVGKRARRGLAPGQLIGVGDVDVATSDSPILIKVRQPVRLVVNLGALKVSAAGEALQEGRAGQLVRVRNVDSKKVITGKVVGEGIVEVE